MATKKDSEKVNKKAENESEVTDNKNVNSNKTSSASSKRTTKSTKSGKNKSDTKKVEDKKANNNSDSKGIDAPSLEEKLAETQDKYIRLSAEFDNYRKRTLKEKMELTKTAGESLLTNILPVMDDFERALQVMESATDCKSMKDGIDLIYSKFQEFLKVNGVKEIKALNQVFNSDIHEALTKIPAPDKKHKGKVVDVIQKGYYLNDKIIRYSKVVIGE